MRPAGSAPIGGAALRALCLGAVLAVRVAIAGSQERSHYPEPTSPPGTEVAERLVVELLEELGAGGVDADWLRGRVRPADLPIAPGPEWYDRLARALDEQAALGRALRETSGPAAVVDGPDYTRVVLEGTPLLSVVVRDGPGGPLIDRFEATTCGLCDERVRFVRDLVRDVERRGTEAHRLLPGLELDLEAHLAEQPRLIGSHWVSTLQARNYAGGELVRLLQGARVLDARGETVSLAYADGTVDSWRIVYRRGRWRLDYAALHESSPLRMSWREASSWRTDRRRITAARSRWTPTWADEAGGLQIGHRAIGGVLDPLDETALVVVLDLDRVLSGVFRVDPELRAVVARWPLPRTSTTALDVDRWFTRWQVAASPDARTLVLSAPGRVWQVDATTGTSRLLTRSNRVSALAATDRHIAVGESNGSLTLFDDGPRWRVQLDDAPIAVHLVDSRVVATTSTGRVVQLATEDGQALEPPVDVCCLSAVDSAVHPDGSEVMVACDAECGSAAERVSWVDSGTRVLEGAGTRHPGVSYSPSGRYLTTGGPDQGLLLWDAWTEQPLATFASGEVRTVSWSADENTLLTVDDTGLARLWDVHGIRRRGVQAR